MAVGDLERLAEGFTNRGLGTSPVASRVIQQAQLQGPEAALQESRATRASEQQSRLAEFALRLSRNAPVAPSMGGSGFNKASPFFIGRYTGNNNGADRYARDTIGQYNPRTGKYEVNSYDINDPKNQNLINLARQQVLFGQNTNTNNTQFINGNFGPGGKGGTSLMDILNAVQDVTPAQYQQGMTRLS